MKTFFINHTRKSIVTAELDAVFNISKNLREVNRKYGWTLDDHIELVNSNDLTHTRGTQLLVTENYHLSTGWQDMKYFIAEDSAEWKAITLCEYAVPGPYGV